jgi:hypothetical protein
MNIRKYIIGFITVFIFLTIIYGVIGDDDTPICLNPIMPNITCYMVTPTLVCDNSTNYYYKVFDNNGNLLNNGTLNPFNVVDLTYYFNFTQDVGTYYIKICDESTRQINVQGDNMIGFTTNTWFYVIIILLFIFFIWCSFKFTPIFLSLDGIILFYMAYTTYTQFANLALLIIMSLVGLIFVFFGIAAQIGMKR